MRVPVLVLACALLGAVDIGSVAAQAPADRERLEALRTELGAVTDTVALLAREAAGIERAKADRDNPLLHLELGFLAYRIGEVTGVHKHYDDAAGEFEWAAELAPEWPYAWYGLGLSELALGEHPAIAIENIRQALGRDFLSKAAAAFARAAQADPSFVQAVVDLAGAARRQRVRPRLDVALRALRAAAATEGGARPALQLARGRVERDLGEGDSALVAFRAFVAVGGDRSLGLLEQARTLFFLRQPGEARAAYYAGAAPPVSSDARAAYRADLAWIGTPEELAAFAAVPDTGLQAFLQRFWASRDAQDARAPHERLAEHYRRYFYALHQFRLVSPHRRYTNEPYRSDQSVLDDRGVIYLRHGEPDQRARFVGRSDPASRLEVEPNESWLYIRPDGNRIFHFVARGDVQDYKLVESLADVFGDAAIAWQAQGRLPPLAQELYESRAALDPEYQRLAHSTTAQGTALASERRAGRRAVREGTTTDGYPLRFGARLRAQLQLFAVGGADDRARVLLVFGVPGDRLSGTPAPGGVNYPLTVRVGGAVGSIVLDTTRVFHTTAPLEAGQMLSGFVEFPLPPDSYALRVAVLEAGSGAGDVLDVQGFEVPDFAADSLVLSDLVLGDRSGGLSWIVSEDTVPLSPRGAYSRGTAAELYYELHGLPVGTPYRARIEVRGKRGGGLFARLGRLFGGGRPVAFSFDGVTTDRPQRAHQTVDLAPLDPGEYVLTLQIETPGGQGEREVPLRVVAR